MTIHGVTEVYGSISEMVAIGVEPNQLLVLITHQKEDDKEQFILRVEDEVCYVIIILYAHVHTCIAREFGSSVGYRHAGKLNPMPCCMVLVQRGEPGSRLYTLYNGELVLFVGVTHTVIQTHSHADRYSLLIFRCGNYLYT